MMKNMSWYIIIIKNLNELISDFSFHDYNTIVYFYNSKISIQNSTLLLLNLNVKVLSFLRSVDLNVTLITPYMNRIEINKGKTIALDILLENSWRYSTRPCLHPPSLKTDSQQPKILQCPTRSWLRGLPNRLLPLGPCRPHCYRRIHFHWLQSPGIEKILPPGHHQIRCLCLWSPLVRTVIR